MQDSWLFEPGLKKQSLAVSNEETEDLKLDLSDCQTKSEYEYCSNNDESLHAKPAANISST